MSSEIELKFSIDRIANFLRKAFHHQVVRHVDHAEQFALGNIGLRVHAVPMLLVHVIRAVNGVGITLAQFNGQTRIAFHVERQRPCAQADKQKHFT